MKRSGVVAMVFVFILASAAQLRAAGGAASAAGEAPKSAAGAEKAPRRDLSRLQKEFLALKFGMFIHFNMGTFARRQWATGHEDPAIFNPAHLDCDQWAAAAVSAHMKYAVLTAKHTGGWCLWDSAYTDHDVRQFKNYKNGRGDVVREFVDAFRKRGLKVGLYYCFPLYSKQWRNYWTLPLKGYAEGTCDAAGFIKNQFKELLTNYGEISVLWVDQSGSPHGGLKRGDWQAIKAYVHRISPNTLVIANNQTDYSLTDIYGYEYPYSKKLPPPGNTNPSEVCDKLQRGWFSTLAGESPPVHDVDYVVRRMLLPLNRNHSNYLLNCGPERSGRLNDAVVARLKAIGKAWNPNAPAGK
ncbi:MAG: alpha-L-fucosidase [Planctomycetes bacterium]|nr:alpha-L-fucosidase [Planctomycetota bacterium]